MKAIETKYFGPTNIRGSRIKAFDCDGNSVTLSTNDPRLTRLNFDQQCAIAAQDLANKLGITGTLVAGWTKRGYVFVSVEGV